MYEWLEQELIGIEPALSEAKAKKIDRCRLWSCRQSCLLAVALTPVLEFGNLYRNGPMAKAKEYADKVIKSSYRLNTVGKGGWTAYQMLFMGDNGKLMLLTKLFYPYFKTV